MIFSQNKFIKLFALSVLFFSTVNVSQASFRDVSQNSKLLPQIEFLEKKGVLESKGFFRAESPAPRIMFWEIMFRDGGFDKKSATFDTTLPENIHANNPKAQYIREGVRRGFIESSQKFEALKPMTQKEALENFLKVKGILTVRKTSEAFKNKYSGVSPLSKTVPLLEAGLASKFLTEKELNPFQGDKPLTRKQLIQWVFNWNTNGKLKISSLDPENKRVKPFNPRLQKGKVQIKKQVQTIRIGNLKKNKTLDEQVFDEVFKQIQKKYRFTEDLTEEKKSKMINAAISGMVKEIGDKYSNYIEPEKAQDFLDSLEGEFQGIGAYVEMIDERFTITSPIKGSPAEKAGLLPGDVVTHVDGESIAEESINEIIKKVRGEAGTKVTLTITRKNTGGKEITVIRGEITVPSLTLEFKNSVAIIGLHQFSRDTGSKLKTMLADEVFPKNPRGIVFDLRNNPGGFLTSAVDVGEIFLKKGQIIFHVDYGKSTRNKTYKAGEDGALANFPKKMVFLQNKGTASASEILNSMIQDHEIGKILGDVSTGKGTVQEVVSFTNGGTLKITVAKWLTPDKRWIHEKGIIPDVKLENATQEQKNNKIDPQLDAAIQNVLR